MKVKTKLKKGNLISKSLFIKKKINILKNILTVITYLSILIVSLGFIEGKAIKNVFYQKAKSEEELLENDDLINDEMKFRYFRSIIGDDNITKLVIKYTKLYNVDIFLFVSIMKVESDFNPFAENINNNGSIDRGLCQLNNNTFNKLNGDDFFNPEKNIENGVSFFKWCLNTSNQNLIKALAFYNTGIGNVKNKKVGEITLDYINKILKEKEELDIKFNVYFTENDNFLLKL